MSFLRRLFGRPDDEDEEDGGRPIRLDVDRRRGQLTRLESALDALAGEMRQVRTIDDPGWRGRVNEYSRLAGEAMQLRRGELTREAILDLVFEVRPLFTGPAPDGMSGLVRRQEEVLAAAEDLRELLPGERA